MLSDPEFQTRVVDEFVVLYELSGPHTAKGGEAAVLHLLASRICEMKPSM